MSFEDESPAGRGQIRDLFGKQQDVRAHQHRVEEMKKLFSLSSRTQLKVET